MACPQPTGTGGQTIVPLGRIKRSRKKSSKTKNIKGSGKRRKRTNTKKKLVGLGKKRKGKRTKKKQ